jgi:hypothetical protein
MALRYLGVMPRFDWLITNGVMLGAIAAAIF